MDNHVCHEVEVIGASSLFTIVMGLMADMIISSKECQEREGSSENLNNSLWDCSFATDHPLKHDGLNPLNT